MDTGVHKWNTRTCRNSNSKGSKLLWGEKGQSGYRLGWQKKLAENLACQGQITGNQSEAKTPTITKGSSLGQLLHWFVCTTPITANWHTSHDQIPLLQMGNITQDMVELGDKETTDGRENRSRRRKTYMWENRGKTIGRGQRRARQMQKTRRDERETNNVRNSEKAYRNIRGY